MKETLFERFSFQPFIIEAIKELRFYKPTEIQERIIPIALRGKSAIGQSQTGTGKTHAYLLPIIEKIDPDRKAVQAVITAPTRELATQIYHEILKITKFCPSDRQITARCFIGGTDKQKAIEKLKTQPHIVVGTPGRINDLIREQALLVRTANTLVVDEADLMLDMGFIVDVDQIAARMPKELQMLVFSATIPEKLKPFLKKYMENPEYVHVAPKQVAAEKIEHVLVPLRSRDKVKLLHEMLLAYNPYLAIVFTNTKKMADEVADKLIEKGMKVGILHGDLSPRERKKMMKQIRDLEFQYIVATDLAARGIDIEGVSHVINYELPKDLQFYIHRAGRTARAGYTGMAATIYEPSDQDAITKLEKMGIEFLHRDLIRGEWVDLPPWNRRSKREKQGGEIAQLLAKMKKAKQVKPGYKKKLLAEMEKQKKRLRRLKKQ
ncbi:DEAD/DEAH box helicase [Parageobacillus thermoglucosidasius]|uniref:DEAD-box ATP-dependent RNA helicase CshB n=1 Tax=Geobacillus sp. (strain Y4.1MC1) TaxID=581103 RepID=A0A7U4DKC5_GEOS0|nr:DEAD/DEAH box helicase [Parageobacillus thermoglucosidasius]AEH47197.1 DEAD/DEAH box helicase domain protein [Parageobacillus thermoglucosidasius C56-YS93]MED4905123.1 DEAD/DEAH box helicase [Parageobacillus thermoglucosidasius]MED4913348.1 DEAD/DEAH box helicase [Parageobacillus thermoglucosidasius]MED4944613.1 DEAD/DEAH box helicase [Parageobacillus thermoglucosidasius]MED4982454.1 DEAD/DEAH box helicase [Parageobacillus thermoglucosidasius]